MTIIDYTSSLAPMTGHHVRYRAEHLWDGTVTKCDFVHSHNPKILAAYAIAGIPSWEKKETVVKEEKKKVEVNRPIVPENWEDMGWIEKRSFAVQINQYLGSEEKVKNKDQAEEVIRSFVSVPESGE